MSIKDAIITNPNDELYSLQQKYNVKISRSNSSDAVYIFRNRNFIIRIGHPISKNQVHIMNFSKNFIVKNVNKSIVEAIIIKEFK